MARFCSNCGKKVNTEQDVCLNCGVRVKKEAANNNDSPTNGKSKIAAGILALFFGTLGVHNFYLGYNSKGATQLILTIVGYITMIIIVGVLIVAAVWIWSFVEAIMIFTGSINKDANGNPLVN